MTPQFSNFTKNLNFSKTSLVMSNIFFEDIEMIISHKSFDFEWHRIPAYQKMLALNPVFCVCQNGLSEPLTMIMLQNIVEAVWRLLKNILI